MYIYICNVDIHMHSVLLRMCHGHNLRVVRGAFGLGRYLLANVTGTGLSSRDFAEKLLEVGGGSWNLFGRGSESQ